MYRSDRKVQKYYNGVSENGKEAVRQSQSQKTAYDTSEYIIVGLNDNYDSNCKIIRMLDLLLTEELKDAAGKTIQLTAEEKGNGSKRELKYFKRNLIFLKKKQNGGC